MGFCITRVVVISIWREVGDNFGSLPKISLSRKARAHVYLKTRNYCICCSGSIHCVFIQYDIDSDIYCRANLIIHFDSTLSYESHLRCTSVL